MHLLIWMIALYGIIPPLWMGLYGIAQGHCWIQKEGHGIIARFYTFYGILWSAILYMIYVYVRLRKFNESSSIIRNIQFFPLALIIGYIPATAKRIYDVTGDHDQNIIEFILQCAMYTGLMLVGFFDGILYGYLWYSEDQPSPDTIHPPPPPHSDETSSIYQYDHTTSGGHECEMVLANAQIESRTDAGQENTQSQQSTHSEPNSSSRGRIKHVIKSSRDKPHVGSYKRVSNTAQAGRTPNVDEYASIQCTVSST